MTDPRAMARTDGGHLASDNLPDDIDPFILRLEERAEPLLSKLGDLEFDRAMLPREPKSDEDVAKITSWTAKAKALIRDLEKTREAEKAPYLEGGKKVDGYFGLIKSQLAETTAATEKRSGPYLMAKRAREEAAAAERARIAREEQAAAERERQRLAREAEEARAEAAREEERLRQAEIERTARQQAAEQQAQDDEAPFDAAEDEGDLEAAEETYRQSQIAAQAREQEAAAATLAAELAAKAADKADKIADGSMRLGKVAGDGASASAEMVWKAKVNSFPALIQSLGPLGSYFTEGPVRDAVDRAAKGDRAPIPGVTFYEEIAVSTRASRTKES